MHYSGRMNSKTKKWGQLGSREEPNSRLGFPKALTVCLIYGHCLPTLISLVQEQIIAMLQGHQDGKCLAKRGHFSAEAEGTSCMYATIFRVWSCCFCMEVSWGLFLMLRFSPFSTSLDSEDGNVRK